MVSILMASTWDNKKLSWKYFAFNFDNLAFDFTPILLYVESLSDLQGLGQGDNLLFHVCTKMSSGLQELSQGNQLVIQVCTDWAQAYRN